MSNKYVSQALYQTVQNTKTNFCYASTFSKTIIAICCPRLKFVLFFICGVSSIFVSCFEQLLKYFTQFCEGSLCLNFDLLYRCYLMLATAPLSPTFVVHKKLQLNFSTTATLATEESDHCRDEAVSGGSTV